VEEKKEETRAVEAADGPAAAEELARVRSSNKVFRAAAIVFSSLFILLLCAVLFIYQKLSGFRNILMPPTETFQDTAFRAGEEAASAALPEGFKRPEVPAQAQSGSALTVFTNSGEYGPAAAGITAEDGERTAAALAKYAKRPIVKEFVAELKKDPDFARALKQKDANNPLAMIASIQKTKSIQGLALKFATRKDFLPLMMEVMNDPDLKPMLSKLPMGNMGSAVQMLKMMSGAAQTPFPVAARAGNEAAPDTGSGSPALLDTSAMQTPSKPSGAGRKKRVPPPPGD
jgi:hypothetical protein